ncbi:MAG: hypothetical protein CVT66_10615 [Actinobacteria bacterium HGW-Actinobacteria-6]|nr:MAG: hypothetical protein CVT66_10615 [Actinobacteria bacterium HGW-Actinobacteria-6]
MTDENALANDFDAFQRSFLRLLERRTAIYTMGDSTSVPAHTAADILLSVCFVLGIDPGDLEVPERLLHVNLEDEFRRRLAQVERKVALAGELWKAAVATMPLIPSTALRDTLAAIGDFPRAYDFRSMAHEIPVMFDYPLCQPVPESLLGVEYINEYLRRLLVEFDFLRRFEPKACVRVIERSSPDFVELLVNLYEPVATNAIGRALLGADPTSLEFAEDERAELVRLLGRASARERERMLREAAQATCDALGIGDAGAREYLSALAAELPPRIEVALSPGELRGVFV